MTNRSIVEIRNAHSSRDGDGVAIQRIAGMQHAGMDPVLMIDELRSDERQDFIGGFPPHPHRGMQTLTYMKQGGIVHEDSEENRGEIRSGGAQWMSAGRGIIHSEMPTQDSDGLHGFQLWVNLPRAQKMSAPQYRDVPLAGLAHWAEGNTAVTVIAGDWSFNGGPMTGPLEKLAEQAGIADAQLAPQAQLTVVTKPQAAVLGYVYDGDAQVGERSITHQQLFITSQGEQLTLSAGEQGAGVLLFQGMSLKEPVAHYGPFVMNTAEEIEQAIEDYQSGKFPGGA